MDSPQENIRCRQALLEANWLLHYTNTTIRQQLRHPVLAMTPITISIAVDRFLDPEKQTKNFVWNHFVPPPEDDA